MKELQLFIIWENAQYKRNEILADIENTFKNVKIFNIKWNDEYFSSNLTRFYGTNLPKNSFKEKECGMGRFSLVLVEDDNPLYEERETISRGLETVNTKMFDAKSKYRKWTGGGHKIHATNSIKETKHDLMLLLGKDYDGFINQTNKDDLGEINLDTNLLGCIQWNSLEELFKVLNESINYVVLRNFDGMPNQYYLDSHGDIDILTDDLENIIHLVNAKPVFKEKYRVHFSVKINNFLVRFDFRYVGDNYYDKKWQENILDTRELYNNSFYIPNKENYTYSLIYHALIHKEKLGVDYHKRISTLIHESDIHIILEKLKDYLKNNGYNFSEPKDLTVFYNYKLLNYSISKKRELFYIYLNMRKNLSFLKIILLLVKKKLKRIIKWVLLIK